MNFLLTSNSINCSPLPLSSIAPPSSDPKKKDHQHKSPYSNSLKKWESTMKNIDRNTKSNINFHSAQAENACQSWLISTTAHISSSKELQNWSSPAAASGTTPKPDKSKPYLNTPKIKLEQPSPKWHKIHFEL